MLQQKEKTSIYRIIYIKMSLEGVMMGDKGDKEINVAEHLDKVINKALNALEKGKKEIFDIAETTRNECQKIERELLNLKQRAVELIKEVEHLEKHAKNARYKLMIVSRNFNKYSQEDIKEAYDKANQLQISLSLKRAEEKQIRLRRNELEIQLKNLMENVKRAENLMSQLSVITGFLKGDMKDITLQIDGIQKRQLLGAKIIQAQEEERKRIARDIHDGPAQTIANVVMCSEVCERLLDKDINKARQEISELKNNLRGVLQELRKIIFDLRPMLIDDMGLVPAIKKYLSIFEKQNNIETSFSVIGNERKLPSILEVTIFRILQEAINNVKKHAKANTVFLKIEFNNDYVTMLIRDDGRGFDTEKVFNDKKAGIETFGLMGIKERAQLMGGKLEIYSKPGKGTRVFLKIPLDNFDEESKNESYQRK
ncbi:MAG: two-component system, NarL family, sensor histidine kinase DegS [Thermosediminibacterales bacterium]|nr:two-component system, NarL family, sensor histidine kinase DegS [Thermosediminibacterales bacterium]MDK2836292.1 two-component system, NarL family, sensor histidine kinase DegS [Thermosediminibacterales bacterium]